MAFRIDLCILYVVDFNWVTVVYLCLYVLRMFISAYE